MPEPKPQPHAKRTQSRHSSRTRDVEQFAAVHEPPKALVQSYLIYDQQLRAIMSNATTANGTAANAAVGFETASTIGGDSVAGVDVKSLGISFDGESVLLPTRGCELMPMPAGQEFSTIDGDLNTTWGESAIGTNVIGGADNEDEVNEDEPEDLTPTEINIKPTRFVQEDHSPVKTPTKGRHRSGTSTASWASGMSSSSSFCCPAWISNAPFYLKAFIACSLLLFVAAMGLTLVALYYESDSGSQATTPSTTSPTRNGNPTTPTVPAPSPPVEATRPPFVQLDDTQFDATVLSFYAMAGSFPSDAQSTITDELAQLPTTSSSSLSLSTIVPEDRTFHANSFLMHLGGWNTDGNTCSESIYESTAQQYHECSVPVMFTLADPEFRDCSNPNVALQRWRDHLGNYAVSEFSADFMNANYQWWTKPQTPELFSLALGHVLLVGLDLSDDSTGNTDYATENLDWIQENVDHAQGAVDVLVLLVDQFQILSSPTFYSGLWGRVEIDYQDIRVVLVHATEEVSWANMESQFQGLSNLDIIHIPSSTWPPAKVEIRVEKHVNDETKVTMAVNQGF